MQTLNGTDTLYLPALAAKSRPNLSSLLIALIVITIVYALELLGLNLPIRNVLYLTATAVIAFQSGTRIALFSSAAFVLQSVMIASEPEQLFYITDNLIWAVVMLAISAPLLAIVVGTAHDRAAVHAMQMVAERQLLRTVIDNLPDYIFAKDLEGRFIISNTAHAHAVQAPSTMSMVGKTAAQFFPIDLAEQYDRDDRDVIQSGRPLISQERKTVNASGERIWVSTTKVPLRDEYSRIIGVIGISRDITERKLAEEALDRERNLLRTIIDNAPDYIYAKDTRGRLILTNIMHARSLGLDSPDEAVGKTDFDFFPPEMAEKFAQDEQHILLEGSPVEQTVEVSLSPSRKVMWASTNKAPLRDENGDVIGIVGITRDITARRQMEILINESRNRISAMLNAIPDLIFRLSDEGVFIDVHGTQELLIIEGSKLINTQVYDVLPKELADLTMQQIRKTLDTGETSVYEYDIMLSVGLRRFEARMVKSGEIEVLVIARDITEFRRAQQQAFDLAIQREHVRVLADFIRDTSHDLRTPLATINTSLYLTKRTTDPDKLKERLENIEEQVNYMNGFLDEMAQMTNLDRMTRLDAGSMDVNRTVQMAKSHVTAQADRKQQTLNLDLQSNLPNLSANELQIQQAVIKLLENAVQYSPEGAEITLHTAHTASEVTIEIRDNGIGIPAADLPHIFERFYKVNKARTAETGASGAGLGLSIVKKIIDIHRGKVEVESQPGIGSTFRIRLPIVTPPTINDLLSI